jgi:hypothetical protein
VRLGQSLSWRSRRASLSNVKARIVGVSGGQSPSGTAEQTRANDRQMRKNKCNHPARLSPWGSNVRAGSGAGSGWQGLCV